MTKGHADGYKDRKLLMLWKTSTSTQFNCTHLLPRHPLNSSRSHHLDSSKTCLPLPDQEVSNRTEDTRVVEGLEQPVVHGESLNAETMGQKVTQWTTGGLMRPIGIVPIVW
jgi:hypothetical protein